MKPILFNTEMVRALLDGRKTVTRRIVKEINNTAKFLELIENPSTIAADKRGMEYPKELEGLYADFVQDGNPEYPLVKAPYRPGDILYVRETWAKGYIERSDSEGSCEQWFEENYEPPHGSYLDALTAYFYRAEFSRSEENELNMIWRPSIHMPKEAARIFLRVTDVRVDKLQCITRDGALKEGANPACAVLNFNGIWDSTIKPADRALYGWEENPWVWVIEFERITKEEAEDA